MTTVTLPELDHTPSDTDDPFLAHYTWEPDDLVALCGKKLKGIPLPESWPICHVCEALADAFDDIYPEEGWEA